MSNSNNVNSQMQSQSHSNANLQSDPQSPVEFNLTSEQFLILQSNLPKKYALIEKKIGGGNKRGRQRNRHHHLHSSHIYNHHSGQNINYSQQILQSKDPEQSSAVGGRQGRGDKGDMSQFSQNNYQEPVSALSQQSGRVKRQISKTKKSDRYLQQNNIVRTSRRQTDKSSSFLLTQQMTDCLRMLTHLKKNLNAGPFIQPVDPQITGATNYFQIVNMPMDLSTVEKKLKASEYKSIQEFHADLKKIFDNSYLYNEKGTKIFKMTEDFEKFYKKLLNQHSKNAVGGGGWGFTREERDREKQWDKGQGTGNKPGRPRIRHPQAPHLSSKHIKESSLTSKKHSIHARIKKLPELGILDLIRVLHDQDLMPIQNKNYIEWDVLERADQPTLKQIQELLIKLQNKHANLKQADIFKVQEKIATKKNDKQKPSVRNNNNNKVDNEQEIMVRGHSYGTSSVRDESENFNKENDEYYNEEKDNGEGIGNYQDEGDDGLMADQEFARDREPDLDDFV